jgi:hypothetical protein
VFLFLIGQAELFDYYEPPRAALPDGDLLGRDLPLINIGRLLLGEPRHLYPRRGNRLV